MLISRSTTGIVFPSKSEFAKTTVYSAVFAFFRFPYFLLLLAYKRKICAMCCLGCNLEDLDFCGLEIFRTRENNFAVQSGVVGVRDAKGSGTIDVCVAVIRNTNPTIKSWTQSERQ
jgi:hypothetical protein